MTVPKSPQITFDAREALREIQTGISSIDNKLTWLSEPSLKGVAHESRQNAKSDVDGPFWLAVAQAADRYHELLVRRRTGRGAWYGGAARYLMARTAHEHIPRISPGCCSFVLPSSAGNCRKPANHKGRIRL